MSVLKARRSIACGFPTPGKSSPIQDRRAEGTQVVRTGGACWCHLRPLNVSLVRQSLRRKSADEFPHQMSRFQHQVNNLKVLGSNPSPATNSLSALKALMLNHLYGFSFCVSGDSLGAAVFLEEVRAFTT